MILQERRKKMKLSMFTGFTQEDRNALTLNIYMWVDYDRFVCWLLVACGCDRGRVWLWLHLLLPVVAVWVCGISRWQPNDLFRHIGDIFVNFCCLRCQQIQFGFSKSENYNFFFLSQYKKIKTKNTKQNFWNTCNVFKYFFTRQIKIFYCDTRTVSNYRLKLFKTL